ncbi:glycosyltransferase, partial [Verrucomicrobia bacterium]|nr:glycosyltransferase [Verrucomicrobiota bacterium]
IDHLKNAHIFVFASSCENMPNTLTEAMAAGLPIACSNCGPMPEILGNGGVYFDPENPIEISNKIQILVDNHTLRKKLQSNSKKNSLNYTWDKTAHNTFSFLEEIYAQTQNIKIKS